MTVGMSVWEPKMPVRSQPKRVWSKVNKSDFKALKKSFMMVSCWWIEAQAQPATLILP